MTEQLTLFAEDTLASLSVWPGSEKARAMTAISGQRCLLASKNTDPVGLLEKMLLDTSLWASTVCYLTWKVKATPQGRLLFQLAPSTPDIDGIESGLWRTPQASEGSPVNKDYLQKRIKEQMPMSLRGHMAAVEWGLLPTLTALQRGRPDVAMELAAKKQPLYKRRNKQGSGRQFSIVDALVYREMMMPTPTTSDAKGSSKKRYKGSGNEKSNLCEVLRTSKDDGIYPHPEFVEALMGYPIGHTALEH